MALYTEISDCRICSGKALDSVLDLGMLALTGVFPKDGDEPVAAGPLELVRCRECALVQLRHNYELSALYGDHYGYRSGLNQSMVKHLEGIVRSIEDSVDFAAGDLVIDIGSNDATLLKHYKNLEIKRVGVDPTGNKFREYYPDSITLVPDFFNDEVLTAAFGNRKAKVITSISMFYDLERPIEFAKGIEKRLTDDGVWVLEQSYLLTMLDRNSYDTVCHEHLEYYGLKQIKFIADKAGLKIIDVSFNDTNGGSFRVTCAKIGSSREPNKDFIESILKKEDEFDLQWQTHFTEFKKRIDLTRSQLLDLLDKIKEDGGRVVGYGASTKGNVLLQYCGIGSSRLESIAEVNEDKFGCMTPGTTIPIVPEKVVRTTRPDYFLVLPWHFRNSIISRESEFIRSGGKFVFPLPNLECFP